MKLFRNHYPYLIGSELPLENKDVDHLVRLFEKKPDLAALVLNGRTSVVYDRLGDIPVAIKFYRRGGLVGKFMKSSYLRSGKHRPHLEYDMIRNARGLGISCPEPLAWAVRGGLFYKGFLVSREVINHKTLVELCGEDKKRCEAALLKAADNVRKLVENGIHHVDLHPGNILVDPSDDVYIIDFDKARISPMAPAKLAAAMVKRWKRAIKKYKLPEEMAVIFERELT
jgi:3-deoxy-D-manno-octulosonic acid kinase